MMAIFCNFNSLLKSQDLVRFKQVQRFIYENILGGRSHFKCFGFTEHPMPRRKFQSLLSDYQNFCWNCITCYHYWRISAAPENCFWLLIANNLNLTDQNYFLLLKMSTHLIKLIGKANKIQLFPQLTFQKTKHEHQQDQNNCPAGHVKNIAC